MKKLFRKALSAAMAFSLAALPLTGASAFADTDPNPVISRNCPVYTGSENYSKTFANDEHYYSFWNASTPDYLAYDLSEVPESERRQVIAVWYNTSAYDNIGNYVSRNMEPSDYTIEVNAAGGDTYPEDGWVVVETVSGNTLSSRQHLVDMEGYNWIRMNIAAADDEAGKQASINFDIHNVSDGVSDSWIFFGDSITAGGMNNCYGTGFATFINQLDERYFPIQENGGIGGITSTDGRNNIDRWLSTYPGKYVSIAYGTNDAWGNQTGAQTYYENTKYMIDAILDLGKTPILPKIPYALESGVNTYLDDYNAMVEKLWEEYGSDLVQGPDFDAYFRENPEGLSSDGVHPNDTGYEAMRQLWAETMYENVYKTEGDEELSGKCGENLTWILDDEGTLTISGTGDMYDYTIDESSPFRANTDIKSVIISDGAASIGDWAFFDCSNITSVSIPDSVISIGAWAFHYCTGLDSITIPDSVINIGYGAFSNCTALSSVIVPSSVENIEEKAFSFCSALESITILNPDCAIYDSKDTISNSLFSFSGIIYGYEDSTAQIYAETNSYTFAAIDGGSACGDANCNGTVEMADAVLILQSQANPDKYGVSGTDKDHITEQGIINADCSGGGDGITGMDALAIQKYILKLIPSLPEE